MTTGSSVSDRRLVLATANRAKGQELVALLAGVPYRVEDLSAHPRVVLPPEGETSYAENALGKARAVTRATGMLALADDSGIEVDAFDGRPGVLSARYGGEDLTDTERNALLLRELAGVPAARRTARYRAAPHPDPRCRAVYPSPRGPFNLPSAAGGRGRAPSPVRDGSPRAWPPC